MPVLGRAVLCVMALSLVMLADGQGNAGETGTTSATLPRTDVCGKSGGRFKRVVGGSDAEPGMFPWIAALGYKYGLPSEDSSMEWFCAGSLVTDRHLVTAAQCIVGAFGRRYFLSVARLGELDLNSAEATRTGIDYEVDTLTVHPGYNPRKHANDIAIIKLKNKVTFSSLIQPICLPTLDEFRTKNFTGSAAYITGWGATEYAGPRATRLQQATVRVSDQEKCKKAYEGQKRAVIDNKVVCAVGDNGSDTCQGDSGGPLMMPYGPDSNHYLYGIVAYGFRCGSPDYPSVYTRVSEYMDWILPNIK